MNHAPFPAAQDAGHVASGEQAGSRGHHTPRDVKPFRVLSAFPWAGQCRETWGDFSTRRRSDVAIAPAALNESAVRVEDSLSVACRMTLGVGTLARGGWAGGPGPHRF